MPGGMVSCTRDLCSVRQQGLTSDVGVTPHTKKLLFTTLIRLFIFEGRVQMQVFGGFMLQIRLIW